MRKLVLGIIALIAVQFAFVTYTILLKSSAELVDDLAMAQPVPYMPDLVKIDPLVDSTGLVTEPETVIRPVEPDNPKTNRIVPTVPERTAKRQGSPETRGSKAAFVPAPADTASPGDFESVVIRYNRNPSVSDCESRDAPKTKKRSYLAKAGPVIKKPWDWLKAIGSKLN